MTKNVKHLKYRLIYNGRMETEDLAQLAINSNEVTVRALAIEKLRASYENRVMELEEKLYGILEADATR
ncbi:hypothetical protein E0157_100 [Escherichia phage SP15]|uniref:Uncharacterized protein n=10 Tax=Tequintavirus TaxID=187218 RepID=A0A9E6LMT2_9CAUD|nr:hypothetical protein SLUR09_00102 [Escherichia phage slur09]YP_009829748.1 hypothetical protein HWA82_gp122 [Escherichia phage SP15]YP_009841434.1 hypothetical protein HWB87_gp055 [Escherichia phage fp01]YP_009857237.1 hypothetical protein HWD13_gp078 [Phage NBSal005]EFG4538797.1 hypothetical protein [Escherichia coli]EHE3968255.1 hypothetical protein [Shigella sonnei]QNI21521.1 hypothetical protein [Salmonella phage 8sent1748]QNI21677.1 hypothetical protein [Salmonella phage 3sent1]QNL2